MTTERCELTELLTEACACPKHRGGQSVQEEANTERLAVRARLLSSQWTPDHVWFPAAYSGRCVGCRAWFTPGTAIRRITTDDHATPAYLAECCEEDHRG